MEGPRGISLEELPLIEELVNGVFRLPEGLPPNLTAIFPRVLAPENLTRIRAVFAGGQPVAVANYLLDTMIVDGCDILTASVSMVATRPDYRHQGLATLILDNCLGLMRQEGVRIVIISGDRGLYRRFGCHPAGIVWVAHPRQEEMPPAGQAALLVADGPEATSSLWRLHGEEDPRFGRSEEVFHQVFQAEPFTRAFGYRSHAFMAQREGMPTAYAIVGVPEAAGEIGRILEYAGDRKVLAGSLRTIAARLGLTSLEIYVPYGDQLLQRLRPSGGQWQVQTMPGTIGLLDPAGLWGDLQPRLVRHLGEAAARRLTLATGGEGAVSITMGQEALCFQDSERLTGFVFGAGSELWPDRALPPNLQRALAACFPLPLPWLQGLNYV